MIHNTMNNHELSGDMPYLAYFWVNSLDAVPFETKLYGFA